MRIGNTPLTTCPHPAFPSTRIRIKDESKNEPSGTIKDRKNQVAVQEALQEGVDTLAVITSGNDGESLARIAHGTGLRIATIVSSSTPLLVKEGLSAIGADVYEADLSQEFYPHDVEALVRRSPREKIWDTTFGSFGYAYNSLFAELWWCKPPDAMIVPVGTGELFDQLSLLCHAYWNTRCIGVEVLDENSKADKISGVATYLRRHYRHKKPHTNEWVSLTEEDVEWCIANAPPGIPMEPSALTVFGALRQLQGQLRDVILINTGKGPFAQGLG